MFFSPRVLSSYVENLSAFTMNAIVLTRELYSVYSLVYIMNIGLPNSIDYSC